MLLADSDYVSVHSPLTGDTCGMFDTETFDTMEDDAVLINVVRGPIVDKSALLDALESGSLRAAALDMFDPEPPATDSPLRDHPLGGLHLTALGTSRRPTTSVAIQQRNVSAPL